MSYKTAYRKVRDDQLASGTFKRRYRLSSKRRSRRSRVFKSRPTAYGYYRGKNLPF